MASLGSLKSAIFEKEERKMQYQSHIRGLNAYDRHKKFMKDYIEFYGKDKSKHDVLPIKTDKDTIREGYRFILSEEDDMDSTWEKRLVKRYYDKLFKEYCIADMSQYKKGKIGLRWRTEKEVISGKGQFVCGNKECNERGGLGSYEKNLYIKGKKRRSYWKGKKRINKKEKEKENQVMMIPLMMIMIVVTVLVNEGKAGRLPRQQVVQRMMMMKISRSIWRACFHDNSNVFG
ncbi:protein FRA10AC1 isoform X2 [Asparagus officinalis]|uniref:protein FRA10AC1 isoform X2 n=1 Tax=Asparagus officinalis TaxID=4686 RepID=UPI00098E487E|nr:protein FRA10AC1 isoform X2 [Asparagus officinalis]